MSDAFIKVVFYAMALAMGVAAIVLGILETQIYGILPGIAVGMLAIAGLMDYKPKK